MAMSQQFPPPVNKYTGSFTKDAEGDGIRMNAFGHEDADIAFDPLSANRPLQHLEASRLGASTPQHVRSRPALPDLCIASSNLLSVMDPLPMDRLSRHTVAEIRLWPAADRHDILAVANMDIRVARQNLAELQLYVDDHTAHLALRTTTVSH